jgi:hypothetical protein
MELLTIGCHHIKDSLHGHLRYWPENSINNHIRNLNFLAVNLTINLDTAAPPRQEGAMHCRRCNKIRNVSIILKTRYVETYYSCAQCGRFAHNMIDEIVDHWLMPKEGLFKLTDGDNIKIFYR